MRTLNFMFTNWVLNSSYLPEQSISQNIIPLLVCAAMKLKYNFTCTFIITLFTRCMKKPELLSDDNNMHFSSYVGSLNVFSYRHHFLFKIVSKFTAGLYSCDQHFISGKEGCSNSQSKTDDFMSSLLPTFLLYKRSDSSLNHCVNMTVIFRTHSSKVQEQRIFMCFIENKIHHLLLKLCSEFVIVSFFST